mmetsp:Transcript_5387/g.8978  ORF Transcript_5387/g.8978 Transcript_5387/m.8978 type:complete len:354 (+) Transcript_5387:36-1097(+)
MMTMKSLTTLILAATMAITISAQNNPRPAPGTLASSSAAATTTAGRSRDPITCPQVPTLHCKNGSTCEEGVANFGKHHDHLDLQTHEAGYYCKCIDGFIGHECGIQVDDCSNSGYTPSDPTGVLRSCYHGSQCRTSGAGFYCDCNKLNAEMGSTATKFAGMMCQHESTSLCAASLVGRARSPNGQFCTNHGKCVKMVSDDEPHPGCVCMEGWIGDHCEVRNDMLLVNARNNAKNGSDDGERGGNPVAGIVLFSMLMIAMGSVTIYIVVILVRTKREMDGGGGDVVGGGGDGDKKVVGVGDLDADGSGTLGTSANHGDDGAALVDPDFAIGDLELTPTDNEDASADDSNEPEIV